jgi:hypothetical protein
VTNHEPTRINRSGFCGLDTVISAKLQIISKKPTRCNRVILLMFLWLEMFRALSAIIRSIRPCVTACGVSSFLFYWAAIQEAAAWSVCMVWRALLDTHRPRSNLLGSPPNNTKSGNTTCCNTRSNAADDGRKRPKHVEPKEHQ